MATYIPAKVSTQFVFYAALVSQANTKIMQVNPTIASGDFKVSIDGGALANLGTLPAVTPASGVMVKFTLSTSEMAGANATVVCSDAAGSEWCDLVINVPTSARQVDDLAYPATSGRSMVVDASGLVDANAVKVGPTAAGTAQTARDIGASVLLSAGSGTGQLDFTSGVVKANLAQILATALTETAGLLAGGFKKFFNVASPTLTALGVDQTGDNYARLGAPAGASVSADVAAVKVDTAAVKVQTDKLAFTVTNQVDSNVLDWKSATAPAMTGDAFARIGAAGAGLTSVAVGTGGIAAASFAANAIDSAALATSAAQEIRDTILSDATTFAGASIAAIKAKTDNLPEGIKKNTALANFEFFMADSADHVTGKTGLTVAVAVSLDGGAFSAATNTPATEVANGIYKINLAAADLNALTVTIKCTSAGADATMIALKTTL